MSWEQLLSIWEQNEAEQRDIAASAPVDCPNDGMALQSGPDGELHCRFDGWIYDGPNG